MVPNGIKEQLTGHFFGVRQILQEQMSVICSCAAVAYIEQSGFPRQANLFNLPEIKCI